MHVSHESKTSDGNDPHPSVDGTHAVDGFWSNKRAIQVTSQNGALVQRMDVQGRLHADETEDGLSVDK